MLIHHWQVNLVEGTQLWGIGLTRLAAVTNLNLALVRGMLAAGRRTNSRLCSKKTSAPSGNDASRIYRVLDDCIIDALAAARRQVAHGSCWRSSWTGLS